MEGKLPPHSLSLCSSIHMFNFFFLSACHVAMLPRLLSALARSHCILAKACLCLRFVHRVAGPQRTLQTSLGSTPKRCSNTELPSSALALTKLLVWARRQKVTPGHLLEGSKASCCLGEDMSLPGARSSASPGKAAPQTHLLFSKWLLITLRRPYSSHSPETLVPKDFPQIKRPLKASRTRQPSRTNLPAPSVNEVTTKRGASWR